MKEYLKMDDVFYLPINESEIMWMAAHDSPDRLECAVHAINSHDELVVEVERLRDALQDAYLDGCHYGWEMSAEGYNAEYGGPNDGKLHNQFIESYSGESYTSE